MRHARLLPRHGLLHSGLSGRRCSHCRTAPRQGGRPRLTGRAPLPHQHLPSGRRHGMACGTIGKQRPPFCRIGSLVQSLGQHGRDVNGFHRNEERGRFARGRPAPLPQALVIIAPARQPIIIDGALVFDVVICGMTEASATRRPSIPFTFRSGSTTLPIWQVEVGWK